jgi:hypothetical protein
VDGYLVIENFSGLEGVTYTFSKDGTAPSIKGGKAPDGLTAAQEIWNGTWYGLLWITDGSGEYEDFAGDISDAYMVLQIEADDSGNLSIFQGDDEDAMVGAYITVDEKGIDLTEGMLWDMDLDADDWSVLLTPMSNGTYVSFGSTYVDPELTKNDWFEYDFRFRPYGDIWEEQSEGNSGKVPPGYDEYLQALEDGVADPYGNNKSSGSSSAGTGGGSSNGGGATGDLSNKLDTEWAVIYYPDSAEEIKISKWTDLSDKNGRYTMESPTDGWGTLDNQIYEMNAYYSDTDGFSEELINIDGHSAAIYKYTDSTSGNVAVFIEYSEDDCIKISFHNPDFTGTVSDLEAIPEIWAIIDSIEVK